MFPAVGCGAKLMSRSATEGLTNAADDLGTHRRDVGGRAMCTGSPAIRRWRNGGVMIRFTVAGVATSRAVVEPSSGR